MMTPTQLPKVLLLLLGLSGLLNAQAGRPLTVDDASVNDVGQGHVESDRHLGRKASMAVEHI